MTDELIVIRTFSTAVEADIALAQLQAAGIQALSLADEAAGAQPQLSPVAPVGIAVHRRDADRALELLSPPPPAA